MIESERQRLAAMSWLKYWEESRASGDQSWLANENTREEIMQLRTQLRAYQKRLDAAL